MSLTLHTPTTDAPTTPDAAPPPATPKRRRPLLLRRPAAAALVGVSVPTWDRLTAAGRNPAPLRLGGGTFWRRGELAAWVRAGCPVRDQWTAIREAAARRRGRR